MKRADPQPEKVRSAFRWALITGLLVTGMKFWAVFTVSSMSVAASALSSAVGLSISAIFWKQTTGRSCDSADPARGSHGKGESLAGLFRGLAAGALGLFVLAESCRRLMIPVSIHGVSRGICVMIVSLMLTGMLVLKLRRTAKETVSVLAETELRASLVDGLFDLGVVFALVFVTVTGYVFWDSILAVSIGAAILKSAYDAFARSVDELMDRSLAPAGQRAIQEMVLSYDRTIRGIRNFQSRFSEGRWIFDFQLDVESARDFKRVQGLRQALTAKIHKCYPGAEVTIR
jgi:cation diffusion facilitator family transporter